MNNRQNPSQAAVDVPPQWQWIFRKLQSIRQTLLDDRAEQKEEFEEPLETPGIDAADSATDEFDHDLALGLLAHEDDALFEVDAAIQRILDGSYGICEMTGKPIPKARLIAIPWTRYSREAMEILEQNHSVPLPHLEPQESIQGPAPGGLAHTSDPEADEPISIEIRRQRRQQGIRNLTGEIDPDITSNLIDEP